MEFLKNWFEPLAAIALVIGLVVNWGITSSQPTSTEVAIAEALRSRPAPEVSRTLASIKSDEDGDADASSAEGVSDPDAGRHVPGENEKPTP